MQKTLLLGRIFVKNFTKKRQASTVCLSDDMDNLVPAGTSQRPTDADVQKGAPADKKSTSAASVLYESSIPARHEGAFQCVKRTYWQVYISKNVLFPIIMGFGL